MGLDAYRAGAVRIMGVTVLLSALFGAGCELDQRDETAGDTGTPSTISLVTPTTLASDTSTPEPEQALPSDGTDDGWGLIRWRGPSGAGATQIMTLGAKIEAGGDRVRFSFDRFPWSSMALAHFFVWDGSAWVGGKFEWIRTGGQSVKSLENVHDGDNGHRAPASGTPVAFAWTSENGKTRSNLATTVWP